MRFSTLSEWLNWQESLHPGEIELGLERISAVFRRMHDAAPGVPVITVAGTNGKGSSVAMLEAIYRVAGYTTGVYTSPHLLRYNERVRINGEEVSDSTLCEAFERVDQARGEVSLTYFEFGTLAALDIFYQQLPDVMILEVGMGGRLDAVNILDADTALITAVSVDHQAWLGNDRETIAAEKAGIMRAGRPVVYSGRDIPRAIGRCATETGAMLSVLGEDFHYQPDSDGQWNWSSPSQQLERLALPALQGSRQLDNASGVLRVVELMSGNLPVSREAINQGMQQVRLPGRFQRMGRCPEVIHDVAHNPDSMAVLASSLAHTRAAGVTLAVVGMLADKDHGEALRHLVPEVDHWFLADLGGSRAMSAEKLAEELQRLSVQSPVECFASVAEALHAASQKAEAGDRIVVTGSFYTVAEAMQERI